MDFRTTMLIQGVQGVTIAIVLLAIPQLFLEFLATELPVSTLSVQILRLLALFLAVLCLSLAAIRNIQDKDAQKAVLLANMGIDFIAFIYLAIITYMGNLQATGGYVLAVLMLVNALNYIPCYRGLNK
ncbi:MAG: hypothetical protein GY810_03455 [Aureispira sp.]|nr:hypothetical protein [Aureispira sp.]